MLRRRGQRRTGTARGTETTARRSALALTTLLTASGTVHAVRPQVFDPIVPRTLPFTPRFWTYASGLAEWVLAALLTSPRTRSLGGILSAVFFVAVFPGNVRTVRVVRKKGPLARAIAIVRLPLQIPLVLMGLAAARAD